MKSFLFNKLNIFLFILMMGMVFTIPQVKAESTTSDAARATRDSVSLIDNDYELTCVYDDGAELTISKNGVYLLNTSIDSFSPSSENIKFFLASDQKPEVGGSYEKLLDGGKCPSKLYIYSISKKKDQSDESDDEKGNNYYYSTRDNIDADIGGSSCGFLGRKCWFGGEGDPIAKKEDKTATLISEEAFLLSSKNALICDYETASTGKNLSQTISIYSFSNMAFIEVGNRTTIYDGTITSCPQALGSDEMKNNNPYKKYIYVNDSSPQVIADTGASTKYYYNSIRFYVSTNADECKNKNDGKSCRVLQYIGSRNDNASNPSKDEVCKLLGNKTLTLLANIFKALQIIVPALVIIFIGIDISKMVLSGNLDEELPKKKKSIIIRLVVMVLFFFIPAIAGLIIKLLNDTGVVNIGDIECFLRMF